MSNSKITAVKGMEDLCDPLLVKTWQWVEQVARKTFERDGFQEIRTPLLEEVKLFERSVGESTEIVEKEMYTLKDRNDKILALRPEGTASVVRAFIEHYTSHQISEGRFYYFGPMFRYEKPQKGRLRQFFQIGAEVFGSDHPLADAELIGMVWRFFSELGLKNIQLHLNSLGAKGCRETYKAKLTLFLQSVAGALCEDCQRRMKRNPLRALDCKKEPCVEATRSAPKILDSLDPESHAQFELLQSVLREQKIPFLLNPRLVRGLDYYEKTVFEFTSDHLGAQNAVGAGGRYNDLVEDLGGPKVPAVGFAVGIERLVSLIEPQQVPHFEGPRVYLLPLDSEAEGVLFQQVQPLREVGARVELDLSGASLKSKMRRASRWGAQWAILYGEAERKKGIVILRNMEDSTQEEVPFTDFFMKLLSRFPTLHHMQRPFG